MEDTNIIILQISIPNNKIVPSIISTFTPDENYSMIQIGSNAISEARKSVITLTNKKISEEYNKFVDENPESELIDYIFSIKILNPYKLPKSNDLYERFALRLLIKESNKHPLTRETLILEELDEFNKI